MKLKGEVVKGIVRGVSGRAGERAREGTSNCVFERKVALGAVI